jgi:cytochrome P450
MPQRDLTDVGWVRTDFDPNRIGPDNVWDVSHYVLDRCPLARGHDKRGDYYVVGKYADVLNVMQDWHTFGSTPGKYVGDEELPMAMPPIDVDPPLHRQIREVLNPYFAPRRVMSFEPEMREIVDGFINTFPDGPFDAGALLFQPLPPVLAFRFLLGLPSDELEHAKFLIHETLFAKHDRDVTDSARALVEWLHELVRRHRDGEGARAEIVDALLQHQSQDGRRLTDDEVAGTIMNLLFAGFHTTTDSGGSFLARLAEHPQLQEDLRADQSKIAKALEEHLRLVPAVPHLSRVCKQSATLRGQALESGDRVEFLITAANRDPDEFERPDDYDLDRQRNRHLTFGGGVHRCIGSHFARLTLRVVFEQILSRFEHIEMASGENVECRSVPPFLWYTLGRIPVTMRARVDVTR